MPGCYSAINYPLIRSAGRREPSREFQIFVSLICSHTCDLIRLNRDSNTSRRHSPTITTSIQILNDDVLLNIFHLYRLENEYGDGVVRVFAWHRQRWWYKLAHVCRLWRNIILQSPSRLDLHLLCTNGVPVADMLAHSPPLPLTICYSTISREITVDDESGISLALSCRDRVHRIHFWMLPNVRKFVSVTDDQFPILEHIYIVSGPEVDLPVTFQAPNLRHLSLWGASLPIGSPLLTTAAAGLVTLSLHNIPSSACFPPSYILTRLSLMLQLENLSIHFDSPLPNRDIERPLPQTPSITPVILPNLCRLEFQGTATYLDDLVAPISAPSLNTLRVYLVNRPSPTVPCLLQFMQTSKNLTFNAVQVTFSVLAVTLHVVPLKPDTPFILNIKCRYLDWQVASAVELFGTLSPVLSVVEKVTFSYQERNQLSEQHNNVDRVQWRELLRPFTNVKTIRVQDDLVSKIFPSLPSDDGDPPLELLPHLEEVEYSGDRNARDTFTRFLNERQVAGHPVSLRLVDHSMFDTPF
jgi:hypothetical protein